MRYVPNLIPDKSKVLRDYFKGDIYAEREPNQTLTALSWILGVVSFICAITFITHPALSFVFALLGFILIPPGHRWIERQLRFRFTTKVKSIVCAALFITAMPMTSHYKDIDNQLDNQLKLKAEQEQKDKIEAEQKDIIRKDSLDFYILKSSKLTEAHKTDDALKQLDKALAFATLAEDKDRIQKEQIGISSIKIFDLIKTGKYQTAIPQLNNLIARDGNNSELIYNRAICYNKIGKIQEAVTDCKAAMQLGNGDAEKLYNKINPIRKRLTGYITLCCDGSTTSRKGRGTCSGHNGVCNWNEPVYEEYRKYE